MMPVPGAPLDNPEPATPGSLEVANVRKRYGAVQALDGIDFSVAAGEIVGLVGHNGAGKSTLMHILAGTLQRDSGTLSIAGEKIGARHSPSAAHARGVRCVFQELSLCPNLDLVENTRVAHPGLRGFGWRRRAAQLLGQQLDAVFPGHGIALDTLAGALPIGLRQMVEIARAYSVTDEALHCMILDEPTSSLSHHPARQLLDFVAAAAKRGIATILISHRLDDILRICGRVVVMVDGRIVANRSTAGLSRDDIAALMGPLDAGSHGGRVAAPGQPAGAAVLQLPGRGHGEPAMTVHRGEIVGLADLDGHGQRACLHRLHAAAGALAVAHVAGDRHAEGLFPLWSIGKNLTIGCIETLRQNALIPVAAEARLAREWIENMDVKMGLSGADIEQAILKLSGGNQQKVLLARALNSPAELIFLDDPTRGVDVGTKQSVYRKIRQEADQGRSFVWYTSEFGELGNCDRVYLFREQRVVGMLTGSDISLGRMAKLSLAAPAEAGAATLIRGAGRARADLLRATPAVLALLVMLGVIFSIRPAAFSYFGINLLLNLSLPLTLAALAQMLVICLGDIDLSIGSLVGFVTCVAAVFLAPAPLVAVAILGVAVGAHAGMALLIFYRGLPSIVVTLGMSFVWLGLALLVLPSPGGLAPAWLSGLLHAHTPLLPLPLWIALLAGACGHWAIQRSSYGVILRGAGASPQVMARFGWSLARVRLAAYTGAGCLAALAGILLTGITTSGDPHMAPAYTLLSIGAVIVGGGAFSGGIISPIGTVIGAMTLALTASLMSFLQVSPVWQTGAQGAVLFLVLAGRVLAQRDRP